MGNSDLKTQRRLEATAIGRYLKHLHQDSTDDTTALNAKLDDANTKVRLYAEKQDFLRMLEWIEKRHQLQARLNGSRDNTKLEAGFVHYAKDFSKRKGISYRSWREVGVPAPVLKKAGVR